MPIVRLTPQDEGDVPSPDTSGPPAYLPLYRLRGWARVGDEVAARQVLYDTGAPACLLPRAVWANQHERGRVAWVRHPPDVAPVESLPTLAVSGGRYPYRIGRLPIRPVDLSGGELAARPTLVICLEDAGPPLPGRVIVGLAGVLDGRSLLVQVSEDGSRWVATLVEP